MATHDSRELIQDCLRLGISGSSFVYVMPSELVLAAYHGAREGKITCFDKQRNDLMIAFMRDLMNAVNSSEITSMECYHSLAWDSTPILELMLDNPQVEFWSVHAPYGRYYDPSSPNPEAREGALAGYVDSIKVARRLGARVVVAHPGVDIVFDTPREIRVKYAAEILHRAAEIAGEYGVKIGIEPMPKREIGNSLDEVLRIVEMIDLPNVGVTFDTNHLFPPENIPDMIRKVGELIVNVHVSDQDGVERHWMPFDGKLDWHAVLEALVDAKYSGPLIYEIHLKDVRNCRDVCKRVVQNYRQLVLC
ncbi:MAG: sugar phosphate isomerase/epimerase [Armatimonadetes bacterium]|nr:sugar phosphate isomerase/epimerase [Armatimonadota bacterium]